VLWIVPKNGRFEAEHLRQRSTVFLSEGHISYNTTVRGPNVLRNVICFEICCIVPNHKLFVNFYFSL